MVCLMRDGIRGKELIRGSSFLGESLLGKWALEGGGMLGPVPVVSS